MSLVTCSKIYTDIPFAHRQHNHPGHCRFIHGHNWSFEFTFAAQMEDACGFVIDFGELKWLKQLLNDMFDHKLVLNRDDPARSYLTDGLCNKDNLAEPFSIGHLFPFAEITVVPDASCEGLARYIFQMVNTMLDEKTQGRVYLTYVRVMEDSKNYATFQP